MAFVTLKMATKNLLALKKVRYEVPLSWKGLGPTGVYTFNVSFLLSDPRFTEL